MVEVLSPHPKGDEPDFTNSIIVGSFGSSQSIPSTHGLNSGAFIMLDLEMVPHLDHDGIERKGIERLSCHNTTLLKSIYCKTKL